MSRVTPNPAAEFSTLAMTKSSDSRSINAGTARRAISRPDLPKMSPMKRMRMLRANRDADFLAASVLDARHGDAELAGGERRACAASVECPVEAHRARETPERALGEVERRLAVFARRSDLLSRNHQYVARGHDVDGVGRHARHVDHDLDASFGLDDVKRGTAFRCRSRAIRRPLANHVEEPLEILRQVSTFKVNPRH